MTKQSNIRLDTKIQVLLSFTGIAIVVLLTIFPPTTTENIPLRKPIIGTIFTIFCALGILAVFSPSNCKNSLNHKNEQNPKPVTQQAATTLRGHHPTCGKYEDHTFKISDRTFCAACIGLLLGGLATLAVSLPYFFGDWQPTQNPLLILFGVAGVVLGLFQFKFKSSLRLAANTVFAVASALVLIGVDGLAQSLFLDVFVFCLIVFWLFTRILLSQWDHVVICSGCTIENCEYGEQKRREG